MTKNKKTIYVLVHCPSEGRDPQKEWDVIQWQEHPALAPHSGGKRKVSTAAGDVELRVPSLVERNYKVLGWASQRIEQLHPRPDMLALENMSMRHCSKKFCNYRWNMSNWQKMVADTMPVHTLSPVNFGKSKNTWLNSHPIL